MGTRSRAALAGPSRTPCLGADHDGTKKSVPDDDVQKLTHEILRNEPPPTPIGRPDEPNPASGFVGLLLYPLFRRVRDREK